MFSAPYNALETLEAFPFIICICTSFLFLEELIDCGYPALFNHSFIISGYCHHFYLFSIVNNASVKTHVRMYFVPLFLISGLGVRWWYDLSSLYHTEPPISFGFIFFFTEGGSRQHTVSNIRA